MRSWFYECLCGVSFHIVWLWERKERYLRFRAKWGNITILWSSLSRIGWSWVNNEVCGCGCSLVPACLICYWPLIMLSSSCMTGDRWPLVTRGGHHHGHQWGQMWGSWGGRTLSQEFILSSIHPASNGSIKENKQKIFVLFASQFN